MCYTITWFFFFFIFYILLTIFLFNYGRSVDPSWQCACGSTTGDNCQCIGVYSEVCHRAGWNESSQCCNNTGVLEDCEKEMGWLV